MKFAILGTRGIPANYGGFETFAEELAIRLVKRGVDTLVVGDSNLTYSKKTYEGVAISKTDVHKPDNPLKFYSQNLKIASSWGADFILLCGVGGNMMLPWYKKNKIPVAVNPDGLGFKRDKYNLLQKTLFYSQYLTTTFTADYLVCDSEGIKSYYQTRLFRKKNIDVIEYGTYINPFIDNGDLNQLFKAEEISCSPGKYHLIVSRLEPENNVKMIVEGYHNTPSKLPLIIVGNTNTSHSKDLLKLRGRGVHFIGGIYDKAKLQLIRAGCRSYWHGHSVGGTNPSLLEAMGSANLCVCHNNIFNRELVRENGLYFSTKDDVSEIFIKIEEDDYSDYKNKVLDRARKVYNWDSITERYLRYAQNTVDKHTLNK